MIRLYKLIFSELGKGHLLNCKAFLAEGTRKKTLNLKLFDFSFFQCPSNKYVVDGTPCANNKVRGVPLYHYMVNLYFVSLLSILLVSFYDVLFWLFSRDTATRANALYTMSSVKICGDQVRVTLIKLC